MLIEPHNVPCLLRSEIDVDSGEWTGQSPCENGIGHFTLK